MTDYLNQKVDLDSPEIISIFDEVPLWSSYFGAVLLEQIPLRKNAVVLDIGPGTGFPLIEMAQRLGKGSKIYGVEPWSSAVKRIREKIKLMNIGNVEITEAAAESLHFTDNFFDMIVSNNGINNVQDSGKVMSECFRVLKLQGEMFFTVNLPLTMVEFYNIFRFCLKHFNLISEQRILESHIYSKRKTLQMNIDMIKRAGFELEDIITEKFNMRFADGSAMLNHFFIKLAFLSSWKEIIPDNNRIEFFTYIEKELNNLAQSNGELRLTIPFACFSCRKS